jgi:bifunctional non-homologous end joining protein LigD
MSLKVYQQLRKFKNTSEPRGKIAKRSEQRFVVQEHHASQLHYDFRLEIGGVLKSWAVPKGPSLDPRQKHLAVQVEDHPIDYLHFEGEIEPGNYGAGRVIVWDSGTFEPLDSRDLRRAHANGKLGVILHGKKLRGQFNLVRMRDSDDQWLLIKSSDEYADRDWKLVPTLKENKPPRSMRKNNSPHQQAHRNASPSEIKPPPHHFSQERNALLQDGRCANHHPEPRACADASSRSPDASDPCR